MDCAFIFGEENMEVIISGLTLLSTVLGPPSALISSADKFSDWAGEYKYRRDTELVHFDLLHEFSIVQERSKRRLEKYIDNGNLSDSDTDKDEYMKLFKELRSDDALYRFTNRPYNNYLSEDGLSYLIADMKKVQYHYKNNSKVAKLEEIYTGYFFEEMAHFDILGRWYNYAIGRNLAEKIDKIQQEIAFCNSKISYLLNDTASIQESVSKATKAIAKENLVIRGVAKTFDSISLYAALAIIGTGVVFLFGILVGIKLEPICLFGIPICLFLSDLLVRVFRKKSSDDKYFLEGINTLSKHRRWFVLILTLLQTIIASTSVFVISEVFSNNENGNFRFWIHALFLGSLSIQIIRSIKSLKSEY